MDRLLQLIVGKRACPATSRSRNSNDNSNSNSNSNSTHISRRPSSDSISSNAVTITGDGDRPACIRPLYIPGHTGHQVDIPLMCEVLNTRRDFTPAVKRAMIAMEAARPETWEQKMLRRSEKRWEKMVKPWEEENMWEMLGWGNGGWIW